MFVGISIELLQPGFELLHQASFCYREITSSITPSNNLREWLDVRYNLRTTASHAAKQDHEQAGTEI